MGDSASGWDERPVGNYQVRGAQVVQARQGAAAKKRHDAKQRRDRVAEQAAAQEQVFIKKAKAKSAKINAPQPPIEAFKDAEAMQVAAMARMVNRIRTAQSDAAAFTEFAIRTPLGAEIKLAPFHREWYQGWESHPRVLVEAPRAHGKTSNVIAYALWKLGNNPNLRIRCLCQNDAKAKERLYEFRMNLENNPAVKLVFPDLKQADVGEWTKTKLYVERTARTRDPSFEAVGIMTAITGGRTDLLICDDVVDMRNAILYPSMREQIKMKFHGEIMGTMEPGGQMIYIATPYSTADLTAVLKANPEWKYMRYVIGNDKDPFFPLWPEKWTRELLRDKRNAMGSVEFDRAFHCTALSGNTVPCRPEWIRYYDAEFLGDPDDYICIQGYDLAISKKSSADYFACVTLLYDPVRNLIFVVDAYKDRFTFAEQAQRIKRDHEKWQSDKLVIERVGLGGGLESYLTEKAPGLPIYPYYPRGDKQKRFMETTPLLEDGRIFFHPSMNPSTNLMVAERGDLITEMLEFPVGRHDDMVDGFITAIAGLDEYRVGGNEPDWEEGDGTRVRMTVVG